MLINSIEFFKNCVCQIFCMSNGKSSRTHRYWLLTIPRSDWSPILPERCAFIKGQCESGSTTGYEHWQVLVITKSPVRLSGIKSIFGSTCHAEPSRSEAAEQYVWKEETRIEGTQFEFGKKPFKRNSVRDWEQIWTLAKTGKTEEIDPAIRVQHYRTLRQIEKDYLKPVAQEKKVYVFWGKTGTGKSRRAWEEATVDAYPKDPNTKFWDGYQGQSHVVIDEFRGAINISHMLRWLDRYPVTVECKFGAVCFKATKIWITSNKDPREWYPELDEETKNALIRRLEITYFGM